MCCFNARGIDGLIDKGHAGRPRKIAADTVKGTLLPLLDAPERAQETHWTVVKFHGYITRELPYKVSYSTLLRYLHQQRYAQVIPRSWPKEQDEEQRKAFLAQISELEVQEDTELWFGDEVGFEGDPRPRGRWVKKGSKPRIPFFGCHLRQCACGAVQPNTGELLALTTPYNDTGTFQAFLDHMAASTKTRSSTKKIVLILDNASWHKTSALTWHHIQPLYLPAYSPDLNPIELLWREVKAKFFTDWVTKCPIKLEDRVCLALKHFIEHPPLLMSLCFLPTKP